MTSEQVKILNQTAMNMLSATQQKKVKDYASMHASGNISLWSMLGGGASASYNKTTDTMESLGQSEKQIDDLLKVFDEEAQKMSHVELDFKIENTSNDYPVSGDLQLYTISGTINSGKGQSDYRMLSNEGTAGSGSETAPAVGDIIPLS